MRAADTKLGKTRPKIGLGFASDWLKKTNKQTKKKNNEGGFLSQSRNKEMRDLRSHEIIFEANLKTTLNLKEDVFMLHFFNVPTDYQDD